MKLMTYNILNGGESGIEKIIDVINSESPDFLTINEANTFAENDNELLKKISKNTGLIYSNLALSGEYDYHVAIFSKYKPERILEIKPLMRACILAEFNTSLGKLNIGGLHLTPYNEDSRHPEIDLITFTQEKYEHKILMGDFNSLSPHDNYDTAIINKFNGMQMKKFVTEGKFRFDNQKKMLSKGYVDSAIKFSKNLEYTAPTSINEFEAHSNMRLDYIFVSKSLEDKITSYKVIKNELTGTASDHYPVVVELEGININS